MYIKEELKINKFREVRIPTKSEYYNTGRFIADSGQYGGENEEVDVAGYTKVDNALALMHELDQEEKSAK